MSDQRQTYGTGFAPAYGAPAFGGYAPYSTSGVLARRLVAYAVDIAAIAVLVILFGFLIGIAGVLTFGLGWMLYAILVPATAILYSGITLGGPGQGTFGMRIAGLRAVDASTGAPVGFVMAALHAILFYFGVGTGLLLLADILIGMVRADRRLGHDLVAGIVVIRR